MFKLSLKDNILPLTGRLALPLALALALMPPAQAQNPYWYLYMGQSLLYPLTRGLGVPYFYGPYSSNPFYSASSLLRRTAGMSAHYPYVYGYNQASYGQNGYRNFGLPSGQSVTGIIDPNTGKTNPANGNAAAPVPAGGGQGSSPGAAYGAAPDPDNFYLPGPQTQSLYATPAAPLTVGAAPTANQMPPVAPAPAAAGTKGGVPLADGFVNHVVTKYNGNIRHALGNSDTRNWAKAMGVIESESHDGTSLSPDRVEVIGRILKDGSLDSVSKVDAVRILLKQKPAGQ